MSVINKMLQDLDQRSAVGVDGPQSPAQAVKAVASTRRGHEWFWRILAVLVLASLGWLAWVAYQVQPRPLVTPLALMVAQKPAGKPMPAERNSESPPLVPIALAQAPKPESAETGPEPVEVKPEPVAAKPQPAARAETLKLARSIETPIAEPKLPAQKPESRKPAAHAAPTSEPASLPSKVVLDKRERSKGVNEAAEARFRRAIALLNQTRVSEAEEQLAAALEADPSHAPARQTYVALLLEQQRVARALHLLREAVDANPTQPTFSLGLARVYAEQREYPAALAVMDKAGPAAQGPEFQVLRAAVLQRLGRHAEAVTAYQVALQKSAQPGATWTGFGISLEALGRHGEASQAYHRALTAGPLPAELRDYAESRIKALQ